MYPFSHQRTSQLFPSLGNYEQTFVCGFSCEPSFSMPLGKYQGAGLLHRMVRGRAVFWEITHRSSQVMASFCIPAATDEGSVAPHPCQHLVLSSFWILAILIDTWLCLTVLVFIFPMTEDVEHLFICLFAICMSSLVKCLFSFFAHFLIRSLAFLLLSVLCVFRKTVLYQIRLLKIFPPRGFSSYFLMLVIFKVSSASVVCLLFFS